MYLVCTYVCYYVPKPTFIILVYTYSSVFHYIGSQRQAFLGSSCWWAPAAATISMHCCCCAAAATADKFTVASDAICYSSSTDCVLLVLQLKKIAVGSDAIRYASPTDWGGKGPLLLYSKKKRVYYRV